MALYPMSHSRKAKWNLKLNEPNHKSLPFPLYHLKFSQKICKKRWLESLPHCPAAKCPIKETIKPASKSIDRLHSHSYDLQFIQMYRATTAPQKGGWGLAFSMNLHHFKGNIFIAVFRHRNLQNILWSVGPSNPCIWSNISIHEIGNKSDEGKWNFKAHWE